MSEATASLIAAAREGDLNAFRQLHAHYIGRTHALCLRLLADRQRAEDACQETFIKVWQQLPEFREESSFSTWLHGIATRTAIDLWRRDKGLRLITGEEPDDFAAPQPAVMERDIEQAIQRLPPQARAVFVLFALEGFTHQEIADALGIAEGSSKAHYHRARQLLKEWLHAR